MQHEPFDLGGRLCDCVELVLYAHDMFQESMNCPERRNSQEGRIEASWMTSEGRLTDVDLLVCITGNGMHSDARTTASAGMGRRRRTGDEALQIAEMAVHVATFLVFEIRLTFSHELRNRGRGCRKT